MFAPVHYCLPSRMEQTAVTVDCHSLSAHQVYWHWSWYSRMETRGPIGVPAASYSPEIVTKPTKLCLSQVFIHMCICTQHVHMHARVRARTHTHLRNQFHQTRLKCLFMFYGFDVMIRKKFQHYLLQELWQGWRWKVQWWLNKLIIVSEC